MGLPNHPPTEKLSGRCELQLLCSLCVVVAPWGSFEGCGVGVDGEDRGGKAVRMG